MTVGESPSEEEPLDAALVAALYVEHAEELRRFLIGVLRDAQLAADALQTTFVRLVEKGGRTREETRKAWLFRVAFHEALALRRRQQTGDKALRGAAWSRRSSDPAADEGVLRREAVESVRTALEQLSEEQRTIVRLRIYEEQTFAQIARQLNIPLGTALARMHSALARLRKQFGATGSASDDPAQ
ncbi:MAG: sigma-70 family RNA polymerase sigma factor [Pirellulales bacterium]